MGSAEMLHAEEWLVLVVALGETASKAGSLGRGWLPARD